MTTAHRPTFHNALGGNDQGGNRVTTKTIKVSSRDLPAEQTLKRRRGEQLGIPQTKEEHSFTLLDKETRHFTTKTQEALRAGEQPPPVSAIPLKLSLGYDNIEEEENPFPEDADDAGPKDDHLSANNATTAEDKSESEGSDDEEAELMRELENIRKERQEEERQKKREEEAKIKAEEEEAMKYANPLVNVFGDPSATPLSKSWIDDVVFKNQAKLTAAQKVEQKKRRFINDAVRSQFHKRFLQKYVM